MSDSSANTIDTETDELQARFRDQAEWYRLNDARKLTPSDLELRRRRVNEEYAALCYLHCTARKLKLESSLVIGNRMSLVLK